MTRKSFLPSNIQYVFHSSLLSLHPHCCNILKHLPLCILNLSLPFPPLSSSPLPSLILQPPPLPSPPSPLTKHGVHGWCLQFLCSAYRVQGRSRPRPDILLKTVVRNTPQSFLHTPNTHRWATDTHPLLQAHGAHPPGPAVAAQHKMRSGLGEYKRLMWSVSDKLYEL